MGPSRNLVNCIGLGDVADTAEFVLALNNSPFVVLHTLLD